MYEQEFSFDDEQSVELLMSMEPPENFWDDPTTEDETTVVNLSSLDYDFNSIDPEITDNSKYWSPVREDDLGAYGNAEMRMAAANFFQQGDVGNDIWLKERELPFGDYGNSMLGFSANVMMLFDFETHPELQRRPDPDIATNYMEEDPTIRWVLEQYNETDDPARKEQLAEFLAEAHSFQERIVEDRFVAVPDWAIDPLCHAMEKGMQYDPQLVPEGGEPSALKTRPVSVVPLPSQLEVKRFFNVQEPVEIKARDTKEWVVALVDGQKSMGPYGKSMGTMHMLRSSNPEDGREVKRHRQQVLAEMLRGHHFQLSMEQTDEGTLYSFVYTGETEDLEVMEAAYGKMAEDISRTAAFNSTLLTYRDKILKELRKDAFMEVVKSMKHNSGMSVAQFLLQETGKTYIGTVTWDEVTNNLEADTVSNIVGRIHSKVDNPTYILEVRKKWGWETVGVTKNEELSKEWRAAKARDIPYFLGSAADRQNNPRPSSIIPEGYEELGDAMKAHVDHEVEEATSNWIERVDTGEETLKRYISQFNAGHRSKKIPAREARHTSWLMNEMPLTQAQLKVAREALADLGQKIVKQRISNGSYAQRIAFRKLQKALESRLSRWTPDDKDLTLEALQRVATGSVDIMFTYEEQELPNEKDLKAFIRGGFVFPEEAARGKMVIPDIKFNHVFHDHSQVFSICKNFRPREDLKRKAQSILDGFSA